MVIRGTCTERLRLNFIGPWSPTRRFRDDRTIDGARSGLTLGTFASLRQQGICVKSRTRQHQQPGSEVKGCARTMTHTTSVASLSCGRWTWPLTDHIVQQSSILRDAPSEGDKTVHLPQFGADVVESWLSQADPYEMEFEHLLEVVKVRAGRVR